MNKSLQKIPIQVGQKWYHFGNPHLLYEIVFVNTKYAFYRLGNGGQSIFCAIDKDGYPDFDYSEWICSNERLINQE